MKRLILFAVAMAMACAPAQSQTLTKLNVGMVSAIDMLAIPVALERGYFEKRGLDVTIARPYATGVDALNALQAGETSVIQVGVPMIGAVLRGMDLVALGNFSGSATKTGSDATMAVVAREGSGIVKDDLKSLKGKKIATSFGTINHLYILALLEKAGLKPDDVTLVNTPPPDMTVALLAKGIDAFSGWDPWPIIALRTCRARIRSFAAAMRSPISASSSRYVPGWRRTRRPPRSFWRQPRKPTSGCARTRSRRPRSAPAGFRA